MDAINETKTLIICMVMMLVAFLAVAIVVFSLFQIGYSIITKKRKDGRTHDIQTLQMQTLQRNQYRRRVEQCDTRIRQ
jgi:hypothetical protein